MNTVDGRCQRSIETYPRTATDDEHYAELERLLRESRQWTQEELAFELGISRSSVETLLQRGGYKKRGPQVLPHELSCYDMERRVEICQSNLNRYNADNSVINRIISIDESWMRCYQPQNRIQASEFRKPGEAPPQIVKGELKDRKVLLVIAVQGNQIIAYQFLKQGETMNSARFLIFLEQKLKPALERRRIERPLLIMDNAT